MNCTDSEPGKHDEVFVCYYEAENVSYIDTAVIHLLYVRQYYNAFEVWMLVEFVFALQYSYSCNQTLQLFH